MKDPKLNGFVHDETHAVTSVALAEGLNVFTDWPSEKRYAIATIALPIAQELFDYVYWTRIKAGRKEFELQHSIADIITYQSAWTVHFVREKKWWQAAVFFALPTLFAYSRYYKKL